MGEPIGLLAEAQDDIIQLETLEYARRHNLEYLTALAIVLAQAS